MLDIKLTAASTRLTTRLVRFVVMLLAFLCGVAWAAALVRTFMTHLGQDQSWLLYIAREVIRGGVLNGPFLVETNPPFVVWFTSLPVLLGSVLHIGILNGFRCFWLAIAAGSIGWSVALFKRLYHPNIVGVLLFALVVSFISLFAINGEDLGQREHITALLLLPYLLVVAFRIEHKRLSSREACLVGIAAAVAICLKPQHLLDVAVLEALVLFRLKTLRGWFNPSLLILGAGLILYFCSVRFVAPTYLTKMVPLLRQTYWGFDEHWSVVFRTARNPIIVWIIAAALYFVLRKRMKTEVFASVLLVVSLGAMLAYLQQHKGWHYQLICFVVFSCLLLGLICVDMFDQWIGSRIVHSPPPIGAFRLAFLSLLVLIVSGLIFLRYMRPSGYPQQPKQTLSVVFGRYPPGTNVSFLSIFPWEFPAILEQEKVLGTRYVHLWLLPAIIRTEDPSGSEAKQSLTPAEVKALSTMLRANEAEDLSHWTPAVVVVDRCTMPQFCDPSKKERFGTLIDWFLVDPAFREQWSHYSFEKTIQGLDVYTRTQ